MGRPLTPGRRYLSVYVPLELRKRLEEVSKYQRRSLSSEIVFRLEQSLARDGRDGEKLARAS